MIDTKGMHHLGKDPKKLNDIGHDDKIHYPTLDVSPDQFPHLKKMKMGDVGHAKIRYTIHPRGGLKVTHIAHDGEGAKEQKAEKAKEE